MDLHNYTVAELEDLYSRTIAYGGNMFREYGLLNLKFTTTQDTLKRLEANYKRLADRAMCLEYANRSLKSYIKTLREENKTLKTTCENQSDKLETLQDQYNELSIDFSKLVVERDIIKIERDSLKRDIECMEKEKNNLMEKLGVLRQRFEDYKNRKPLNCTLEYTPDPVLRCKDDNLIREYRAIIARIKKSNE